MRILDRFVEKRTFIWHYIHRGDNMKTTRELCINEINRIYSEKGKINDEYIKEKLSTK